jgi:hypothetical protein
VEEVACGGLHPDVFAVFAEGAVLDVERMAGLGEDFAEDVRGEGEIVRVDEVEGVAAYEFIGGVPVDAGGGGAGVADDAGGIEEGDAVPAMICESAEEVIWGGGGVRVRLGGMLGEGAIG